LVIVAVRGMFNRQVLFLFYRAPRSDINEHTSFYDSAALQRIIIRGRICLQWYMAMVSFQAASAGLPEGQSNGLS
jgi:hypothetical protein